jgi:hypothetical protein
LRKNANPKNPWISPNTTVRIAIVLWSIKGIRYPLLINPPIVAVVSNNRSVNIHPYIISGNQRTGVNAKFEIIIII